ncbi:MAG: autotransporter-associated beta strand repeat-containing protein [Terrimicrobiaceae bacterium]
MKKSPRLSSRLRAFLRAVSIASALGLASAFAQTDYSWNNAGTGVSAGTWNTAGNWSPSGPPPPAGNVVTPTLFGDINVNISSAQVTNWTYNSTSSQTVFANGGVNSTLTISGTLSKAGSGNLTFRNVTNNNPTLDLSAGSVVVSSGTLFLGTRNNSGQRLGSFSFGSVDLTGGSMSMEVAGSAAITGALTMSNTPSLYIAQEVNATRSLSVGSLSSASTTAVIAANDFGAGNKSDASLLLTASSGAPTFAGVLKNSGGVSTTSSLSLTKGGVGTQVLTGNSNTYSGGTTVNAGTLLVNNASGSGLGAGAVSVNGGVLGGTGSFTGAVTVNNTGTLSPGASIQTLASGTATFNGGSTYAYEVDSSVAPAAGADLLVVTGALNLNDTVTLTLANLDLTPDPFAEGTTFSLINYNGAWNNGLFTYNSNLLSDGETFSFNGQSWQIDYNATVGGVNFITEYLPSSSFVNITTVPEPETWGLLAVAGTFLVVMRRRRTV